MMKRGGRPKRKPRDAYSVLDWLKWMPAQIGLLTDGSRAGRAAEQRVIRLIRQEVARELQAARKPRSFSIDLPNGGYAMVHGDPKMNAKSRAALGELLDVAYRQMQTPAGRRALKAAAKKARAERDAERDQPKTMRIEEPSR